MSKNEALLSYFKSVSNLIEEWVKSNLQTDSSFNFTLYESMRYSLLAGGKRLRPALSFASYNIFNNIKIDINHPLIPFSVGLEMMHTYSLIHDDLPAMDNDDLRRGKPTNHIVFGEATAILAGDALLTKSFELFSDPKYSTTISPQNRLSAILILAKSSGSDGMVGGQYADIAAEKLASISAMNLLSIDDNGKKEMLNYIHKNKTAELINASILIGATVAGADAVNIDKMNTIGMNIGTAFQIIDDILDATSTTEKLGKTAGSDIANSKLTYPSLYGLEQSQKLAAELVEEALEIVKEYGSKADTLLALTKYITGRER